MKVIWFIIIGGVTGLFIVVGLDHSYTPSATHATPHASTDAFMSLDWHPAGRGEEVRWINDDPFTHVGGHCYGRKIDGSTRTEDGQSGLAQVGEKFCIAFGAKDTPFDVPDQR
jgi:hypothetical protein